MSWRVWAWLAACSLLLAAPAAGTQRVRMTNGLTLLLESNQAAEVVSIRAAVAVSAADEPAGLEGIRYLTHQLLLRGSARRDGRALAAAADGMGAVMESGLESDYAYLEIHAPAAVAEPALALLAEVLLQPAFAQQELEAVRQAAQGELARSAPAQVALQGLWAGLYGGHPYGRGPAGVGRGVSSLTREQVVAFYRCCYRPERTVLAICGGLSAREAWRLAAPLFSGWAAGGELPTSRVRMVPQPDGRTRVRELPVRDCYLLVGFLAPGLADPDYPALVVLNTILGAGMGSRLYGAMRDQGGVGYQVYSQHGQMVHDNYLAITAVTSPARLQRARELVLAEVARLRSSLPTEQELQRARRYAIGTYLLDHQRNRDLARHLSWYEVLGLGYTYNARLPVLLEKVTAADVTRVARRYLTKPALSIVLPGRS